MQVKWGTSMFHTILMLALSHKDTGETAVKIWTLANLFQMNKCACSHPSSKLTEVVPGLWSPFLPFCPCVSLDIRPGWGIWAWTTCQVLRHAFLNSEDLVYAPTVLRDLRVSRISSVITNLVTVFVSNTKTVLLDTFLYLKQKWYCLCI